MNRNVRRWAIFFAALGLAAASASLYVHYRILTQPGYVSGCDINQTFSCSDAYRSEYGSLLGIPVALFGVLWFVLVLLLVTVGAARHSPVLENATGDLFVVSAVGLAFVLYLAYAAFFVLHELCVFCLCTYGAVVGLFVLSAATVRTPLSALPRRAARDLRLLSTRPLPSIVAILFLAACASSIAFFGRTEMAVERPQAGRAQAGDGPSDFDGWWASQPRAIVPVSSQGAAVVIVKFTDYECPLCGRTYFDLKPILAKYDAQMPGAVTLISKDFPLDQSCNPRLPRTIHPAACDAAVAVRLARQWKRDADMEDWLYSNQGVTPAAVREAAARVGHVADFDGRYAKAVEDLKGDLALAELLKIGATPTFFVNGVRTDALTPTYWDMAIRYELKRAGRIK